MLGEAGRRLLRLNSDERLAVAGVALVAASLPLPWWRSPQDDSLVLTGIGGFSFAEGALLLTVAAVLLLVLRVAGGYDPPRPLQEGGLVLAGGLWAAAIVAYRMFDRPDFTLGGADEPYQLGYGIMLALAGAALVAVAGLRLRRPAARGA